SLLIPSLLGMGYALAYLGSFLLYTGVQTIEVVQLFGVSLKKLAPLMTLTILLLGISLLGTPRLTEPGLLVFALLLALFAFVLEWQVMLRSEEREKIRHFLRCIPRSR